MEEVTNYLDSRYRVAVIYLNFQKVFDKVPHQRPLIKLQAHGIGGIGYCNKVHLNYVKCIIVYTHITLALYRLD